MNITGQDGMYFIDRNGDNFGHILDFLRDGLPPSLEPASHELRSFGPNFLGRCLYVGRFHPLKLRS